MSSLPQSFAYLDYAATYPLKTEVLQAMMPHLSGMSANPSSLHTPGREAALALENARTTLLRALQGKTPQEVIFTSGGTESDNLAIKGLFLHALQESELPHAKNPAHLVVSDFEHKAVLSPAEELAKKGFKVSFLRPRANGFIAPEDLDALLEKSPAKLVSIMMVNNEIGTLQDIKSLAQVAHRHGALFHTDAVQAFGKVPLDVKNLGLDAVSLSAHKIGGPRGVGALWLKSGLHLNVQMLGGGQENNQRSGTQNVVGAVGFAKAAQIALQEQSTALAHMEELRVRLVEHLQLFSSTLPAHKKLIFPAYEGPHMPGILGILAPGFDSETLILRLDIAGFCVAGGAACSSTRGKLAKSRTLRAIGISDNLSSSFIRVSFSPETTPAQIDAFAEAYISAITQ